jgi:TonB family protein
VYAEIAVRANIQGVAVLRVLISKTGQVEDLLFAGGGVFFGQAALDAVRQWRFRPFLVEGGPIAVHADVVVPFYLNDSNAFRAQMVAFGSGDKECRRLLEARRFDAAEPVCAAHANLAGKLDNAMSFERAGAYHLAGEMLTGLGRIPEALEAFNAEVKLRSDGSSSDLLALAHWGAARAFASTGDSRNARRSYERAEAAIGTFQRLMGSWRLDRAGERELRQGLQMRCLGHLRAILTEFVAFLERTGQAEDARKARQRLDSLPKEA